MSAAFENQVQTKQLPPPSQPQPAKSVHGAGVNAASMSMAQSSNQQVPPYMNNSFVSANSTNTSPPKAFGQPYQNQVPPHHNIPVTQSLPATPAVQQAAMPVPDEKEKPQSNGTIDAKTELKEKEKENHHVSPQKNSVAAAVLDNEKAALGSGDSPQGTEAAISSTATVVTSSTPVTKVAVESKEAVCAAKPPPTSTVSAEANNTTAATPAPKSVDAIVESSNVDTISSTRDTKTKEVENAKNDGATDASVTTTTPDAGKVEDKQEVQSSNVELPVIPQKPKEQITPTKSPMKVATTPRTPPQRKSRTPRADGESPRSAHKPHASSSEAKPTKSPSTSGRTKRVRIRTQHYQSPLPELEIISKITQNVTPKSMENKLIVFYKQEFLAVRNAEGSFFVCQAVQNVYKSSARIKIRWLSQDKNEKSGEIYTPDFYDLIDFECILTNLDLTRVEKGKYRLPPKERERTDNILKRAIAVEKGEAISLDDSMTEDNPDGLDVSLYTEEEQLKKKASKRKLSRTRRAVSEDGASPPKRVNKTPSKMMTPRSRGKKKAPATPASEPTIKSSAAGRQERAKRRSGALEGTKSSPIIDNKKAKVLAKVVKRSAATATATSKNAAAAATPNKTPRSKGEVKATKQPVASTSKAKTPKAASTPPAAPTRKTPKRQGRK